MSEYEYRAMARDGTARAGRIQAERPEDARLRLQLQGLTVLELREPGSAAATPEGERPLRLTPTQILDFSRELWRLVRAGLALDRALRVLTEMYPEGGELHRFATAVAQGLRGGKSLTQALAPYESLLGSLYLALLRAGEASGRLDEALADIVRHLEAGERLRASIASALIYPAILVVVAIASIVLMLAFVVPQFEKLFEDLGEALPLLTRAVVALGHFFQRAWYLVFAGAVFIVWAVDRWRRSPGGARRWDELTLRLPLLGRIRYHLELARYFQTFGTLLGRGVPMLQAAGIARETLGNLVLRERVEPIADALKRGERLSLVMGRLWPDDRALQQILRVGDETGRLAEAMTELAQRYEEDAQQRIKRALTLLEPAIIVTLGAVVAVIIIAVLTGILSVNQLAV
ncbi:MAG: type II secretion system F family protein [Tepidiphilus sp.]|nr:type II secretion system F family protein [Tepidiphilus sp.]MDD3432642.1 type II secretion system F family protein [Tepidiphilus sp.]